MWAFSFFFPRQPEIVLPDAMELVSHVQVEHGPGRAMRDAIIETFYLVMFYPVNKTVLSACYQNNMISIMLEKNVVIKIVR